MLCCAPAAGFPLPPMIIFATLVDNTGLMARMTLCMPRVSQAGLTRNYLLRGSKKFFLKFAVP